MLIEKLNWVDETPERHQKEMVIEDDKISVRVKFNEGQEPWQHMLMSFGEFGADRSLDDCLDSWPLEAIAIARSHLDRFEAMIRAQLKNSSEEMNDG